jgi:hypothetical protein
MFASTGQPAARTQFHRGLRPSRPGTAWYLVALNPEGDPSVRICPTDWRQRVTSAGRSRRGVDCCGSQVACRRPVVGVLERTQADKRAITRMRRLRQQFGGRPVELVIPGRRIVVLTEPSDVGDVLAQTPTPFHPASWEKRYALTKFQPHGVLISRGSVRAQRRELNEAALDSTAALHHLSSDFASVIEEEARAFATKVRACGELDAAEFTTWWWQLVRRIVLGDAARDDDAVTDDLWYLRKSGSWSFQGRSRARRREHFSTSSTPTPTPPIRAA